jgi:hypothetical protein
MSIYEKYVFIRLAIRLGRWMAMDYYRYQENEEKRKCV